MWVSDGDDELWSFGGSVGYTTPTFETLEEARDFLLAGIDQQQLRFNTVDPGRMAQHLKRVGQQQSCRGRVG